MNKPVKFLRDAPVHLAVDASVSVQSRLDQYTSSASNFLRNVGYPAVIIGLIALNFSTIQNVGRKLPDMVSHVQSMEALGMKVAINSGGPPIKISAIVPAENQKDVLDVINRLGPDTVIRFLNVEQSPTSCEHERPLPSMRKDIAMDYELQEIGVLTISSSAFALDIARDKGLEESPTGLHSIGMPVSCYRKDLTSLGYDVKTALVQFFSKAFDARVDLK